MTTFSVLDFVFKLEHHSSIFGKPLLKNCNEDDNQQPYIHAKYLERKLNDKYIQAQSANNFQD